MLRLCGAELLEAPALPFSNQNNYQHVGRRLADELRKTEKNGVLFADQWNNLDNSKAHYTSTGPGNLGTDRRQDRRIYLRGGKRRHARRGFELSQGKEKQRHDRRRRSARRGDVQLLRSRRDQSHAWRIDYRRHRPRPRHGNRRADESRQGLPHSRRGRQCRSSSNCSNTKACASVVRPASTSPARSKARQGPWVPATPSSPCCATAALRYPVRSCSIRNSCARKNLARSGMVGTQERHQAAVRLILRNDLSAASGH